jgi:hypothetical protein
MDGKEPVLFYRAALEQLLGRPRGRFEDSGEGRRFSMLFSCGCIASETDAPPGSLGPVYTLAPCAAHAELTRRSRCPR